MKSKILIYALIGVVALFALSGCTPAEPGSYSAAIHEGQWERDLEHNAMEAANFVTGGSIPNYVVPGEGH